MIKIDPLFFKADAKDEYPEKIDALSRLVALYTKSK